MKLFSTKTHGVLDYVTAGTLFALPRMMDWSPAARSLLTNASLGTVAYSLLTRYELGLWKVLPMKGHLALDAMSGLLLAAAPFLLLDEDTSANAVFVALGLFEIGASLMTETEPSFSERTAQLADAVTDRAEHVSESFQERAIGA